MSKDASGNNDKARYWLQLKQAWDAWKDGAEMPPLAPDAQSYFESMAFGEFSRALAHPSLDRVPKVSSGKDAWAHVLHYLLTQRPVSRHYVLDDMFVRARARAASFGMLAAEDEVEQYLGWLLKQFQMRLREIIKAYVRESGTPIEIEGTDTLNKPLGNGSEGEDQTLESILAGDGPTSWEALAEVESKKLGPAAAAVYFPGIRPDFKLSIFLRSLKLRRAVTISCTEDVVLALAGIGHAVFAAGAKNILEQDFPLKVLALPKCAQMDKRGQYDTCVAAMQRLLDLTDAWFWIGRWLEELGGYRQDIAAAEFALCAEAFVTLLDERLKEAGDNSSEIAINRLFTAIKDLS